MIIKALATSSKIVIGEVMKYESFTCEISKGLIEEADAEKEAAKYEETRKKAEAELLKLKDFLIASGTGNADFADAHIEILNDRTMNREIGKLIANKFYPADRAIAATYDKYIEIFGQNNNPLIVQRAADLRDVRTRVLRNFHNEPEKNLSMLSKECIIVADELFPTDTLALDKNKIKGFITQKGGLTSHTAIIARTLNIPALLGAVGILDAVKDGDTVIIDGSGAQVVIDPDEETVKGYEEKILEVDRDLQITHDYYFKESVTKDGTKIDLRINIASDEFGDHANIEYLDGVGLYRSEFLYLSQPELPSEELQFNSYKNVAEAFGEKPVILRTLDIGGDKQVAYMQLPKEENPFLGNRGIRLCLTHKDIFRTQLRAALRASAFGNLQIMFPMVTSINEFREAKAIINEIKAELDAEGIAYNKDVKIGIMIEVPSIALAADKIIDEIDFASVGTNDLIQYMCATDRMNEDVQNYYQDFHPAIFTVLGRLADTFKDTGKCLSICGEMGGDPLAIPLLVGLGIRTLSMSNTSIAKAKRVIRNLDIHEAQALAKEVLESDVTNIEVTDRLNRYYEYMRTVMVR